MQPITRHRRLPIYRLPASHGAEIEIGRRRDHADQLWPRARSAKWRGRCWLELSARDVIPRPGGVERLAGDVLEIDCDRPLGRGRAAGETHRIRPGSLKWEVVYESARDLPMEGYAAFDLASPAGLAFHYQPPLRPDELAAGFVQPENVVGSYAAYWRESGRIVGRGGPELADFGTGKFCHLYRPEWVSADGEHFWGEQRIVAGQLRIPIPTAWIRSLGPAAFPLTLDPEIGHSSIGASLASLGYNYLHAHGSYQASATGELEQIAIYSRNATSNVVLGVYADSAGDPAALLGSSAAGGSLAGDWTTLDLASPVAVSAGSDYHLAAAIGSANLSVNYDAIAGTWWRYRYRTYDGSLPDPFGSPTPGATHKFSTFATIVVPFSSPAVSVGRAADSLRLYDDWESPAEVPSLDLIGTIPGVRPVAVAGRCGPGIARLRANADGSALAWRAPGSAAWGPWVGVPADGTYLLPDGTDGDAWLRVYAHTAHIPAQPADALVELADRYENAVAGDDVTASEASAGDATVYELVLANDGTVTAGNVRAWLDASVAGLELSADGTSWSSPTTEAAGIVFGDLAPGDAATVYLRRTIAAGAGADPAVLNLPHFAFDGL